jgi:N-acetylmuramoyl-L-alanine amidase
MIQKVLSFLFLLTLLPAESPCAYKVVIDPGHGGSDHGAVRNGLRESDIVLKVSKKLLSLIENDPDFNAKLTRKSDHEELSLKDRVQIAKEYNADVFISVHANASTDSRVKGVEFYFSPALTGQEATLWLNHLSVQTQSELTASKNETTEEKFRSDPEIILHALKDQHRAWESQELSRYLWSQWTDPTHRKAVRQAPFYVVNSNFVPAVLVEIGYLSNPKERDVLANPEHQERIARQIFQGLKQFKEFMDNSSRADLE